MAYRYYSTRRPLMVGGIPSTESVTEIVNFESGRTYCEEIDNKAYWEDEDFSIGQDGMFYDNKYTEDGQE